MSRVRTLTMGQRVVLIVGLGVVALVAWHWWYLGEIHSTTGWFAYEPDVRETDTYFVVANRGPDQLAVPIALAVAWAALSICLLGAKEQPAPE